MMTILIVVLLNTFESQLTAATSSKQIHLLVVLKTSETFESVRISMSENINGFFCKISSN